MEVSAIPPTCGNCKVAIHSEDGQCLLCGWIPENVGSPGPPPEPLVDDPAMAIPATCPGCDNTIPPGYIECPYCPKAHSLRLKFPWGDLPVLAGTTVVIGRSLEECPVALQIRRSYPNVSRRHVSIEVVGNLARVTELGSKYGTLVNGATLLAGESVDVEPGGTIVLSIEQPLNVAVLLDGGDS